MVWVTIGFIKDKGFKLIFRRSYQVD